MAPSVKSLLTRHAIFSHLLASSIERLAERFTLSRYETGQMVLEPGEASNAAFMIAQGKVRVLSSSTSLGQLGTGVFFGGHSRKELWQHNVGCRASEDCLLYRISRADFEALLQEHPEIGVGFDKSLEEVALLELLKLTDLLLTVPSEDLMEIIDVLGWHEFAANESAFCEGDNGDSMLVVSRGRFEVTKQLGGQPRRLAELTPGHFFGEQALFGETRRIATVTALEDSYCYRLDRDVFNELDQRIPLFSAQLRRRALTFARSVAQVEDPDDVVLIAARRDQLPVLIDTLGAVKNVDEVIQMGPLVSLLRLEELCATLSLRFLPAIVNQGEERWFVDGSLLFSSSQQSLNDEMLCLIVDGCVVVREGLDARDAVIARLLPGEFFLVESAALTAMDGPSRSYEAHGHTRCLLVSLGQLDELQEEPQEQASTRDKLRQRALSFVGRPSHRHSGVPQPTPSTRKSGSPAEDSKAAEIGTRFPWIGQRRESECGIAALATVAKYMGMPISYDDILQSAKLLPLGISLLGMTRLGQTLGFGCEVLHADDQTLFTIELPVIVHWRDYHYVVLYQVEPTGVVYADPSVGLIKTTMNKFLRSWNGRILTVIPPPKQSDH